MKKRLIKVYVCSVALYGCEVWVLKTIFCEHFEMWCSRTLMWVSGIERRTKDIILSDVNETRDILSVQFKVEDGLR